MKKILSSLLFALILTGFGFLISCNGGASSGSNFEGVINYEIQGGAGLPPEIAPLFQSMKMKTYIKGDLSRSEEEMEGYSTIVIGNSKTPNDPIRLISMLGHKYAVTLNDSMKKVASSLVPKIEYIDSAGSTKQIAGYNCKKARITVNIPGSGAQSSYLYYTTDLPYADPEGTFKGLKGMPMEFSINMEGINIDIVAKSVEKKTLSDSLFTVPADYKKMSIDELQKEMMKAMGSDSAAGKSK